MTPGRETGYLRFRCEWERAAPPLEAAVDELRRWRDRLYALGLVGAYPDGIGYGNLSCRARSGSSFFVSGTATGLLPALGREHFTEVVGYHFDENRVRCRGPVQASSESLSHAVIYECDPAARAAIHVHHPRLWSSLYGRAPTTDPSAEGGTPEMAAAIRVLFRAGAFRDEKLLVMGGHEEGILAFGGSPDEAGSRILRAYEGAGDPGGSRPG